MTQVNNPDAAVNQLLASARGLARDGRIDQAMAYYAEATRLSPRRVEPYLGSGGICFAYGRFAEALHWFDRARDVAPDQPDAVAGRGQALLALGRPAEALEAFERLRTIDRASSLALHGAGEALQQLGRIDEARQALEGAVALAPDNAGHHFALAQLGRFVEDDPRLPALERLARRMNGLPQPAQCELHFALAKACDELGRHAEAFEHWRLGNAIKRRHVDYNEAIWLGILRDLAAAFTPATVAAHRGSGDPSDLPVFVIGMPRSGTTLVEQILASHPEVFGAGESMVLHELLGQDAAGPQFPSHFAQLPNEALRNLGSLYAARLKADAPQAKRIVDKLPANFMLVGLIHLALPNARIIHVRRDPLDTCLSCYASLFSQNIDYSYDLGELGRYYRAYDGLMAHWRALLGDAFLELRYEDLVDDLETQARRLIAYCGLEWSDDCLSFHRTPRTVHTLSSAQVRQPLYRSAIGRAQPYMQWLGPLQREIRGRDT